MSPVLANSHDLYAFRLLKPDWDASAAPTQFLRDMCSHEICALALTELVVHGVRIHKSPVYQVFLDKQTAFDSILKEHVVCQLLLSSGSPSQALAYFAASLAWRSTLVSLLGVSLGPIRYRRG